MLLARTRSLVAAVRQQASKLKAFATPLKYLWLIAVVLIAVLYARENWTEISRTVRNVNVGALAASTLLLVLAKILISMMIVVTIRRSSTHTTLGYAFHMYNTTQVAKYIPGAIWHFVGRALLYRKLGMNSGQAGKALLTESLWLVIGACLVSIIFLTISIYSGGDTSWVSWLRDRAVEWGVFEWGWIALLATLLCGLAALFVIRNHIERAVRIATPNLKALFLMIAIQIALGLSFYAIVHAAAPEAPLIYVVAVNAAATALGYVALFAPSGLGVKEGVVVFLLAPYMSPEVAFSLASVHRLIYVVVDLLLGGGASLLSMRGKQVSVGADN
ncbi:MAG: hypothetical protein CME88_13830 [Hirschia sp.]|nr:hypothetical protein [Hirschia sp.]MBF19452.1 hypothetical protein [Hirschia sp.]